MVLLGEELVGGRGAVVGGLEDVAWRCGGGGGGGADEQWKENNGLDSSFKNTYIFNELNELMFQKGSLMSKKNLRLHLKLFEYAE